ncbi:MAG: Cardiolipin synthase [Chlamydiae bacterium]|nr:Cardiolipin synthase [Chlamydiota bacterium]
MNRRSLGLLAVFVVTLFASYFGFLRAIEVELPSETDPFVLYSSQTRQDLRETHCAAIDQAEKSITLIIFTMRDRFIIEALNKKAEEGVDVYVVYDARAAKNLDYQLSKKVKKLKRDPEGITHQKILIVDDELVLMGTSNMTTASLRYYDNLVTGIWSSEIANWLNQKISQLGPFNDGPGGHQVFDINGQHLDLWFLPTGPKGPERILQLIRTAKDSLKIAMFTWTRLDFAEEVIQAYRRGVDVQVVIDKQSGYGASIRVIEALREAGVPLYFNKGKELLHTKTMMIDDQILVNGSANWTKSAFTRNDDCFMVLWTLTTEQQRFMNNFLKIIFLESNKEKNDGTIKARL